MTFDQIIGDIRKKVYAPVYFLHGDEAFYIGRSSECDLTLDQETISRRHTKITVTPTGHQVEDMGSTNGTLVNGRPIVQPVTLKDGDDVQVGDVVMRVSRR